MSKRFHSILLGVVVALAMGGSGAYANCTDFGGFAIFQCADLGFFAPPPVPVTFDPNAHPTNISAVFWQVGFGNHEAGKCVNTTTRAACTTSCATPACLTTVSGCTCISGFLNKNCGINALPNADGFCSADNGIGANGTGNSGLNDFNGNDSGPFVVDLKDAQIATANPAVPFGATCLSSNNWGNSGIDGCADDFLSATIPAPSDDGILNPYYNVDYARNQARAGYYNLAWQQDGPMAVLLKTMPDARYFAIAGTSTLNRGSDASGIDRPFCDGTCDATNTCMGGPNASGPCTTDVDCETTPGNPAVCDVRPGFYSFKDVVNGMPNPATGGATNNVVPWQQVPRPRAACISGCTGTPGTRTINFNWDPVRWSDDSTHRPSANALLGPTDPNRQSGVGFLDYKRGTTTGSASNYAGLVRYNLQSATVGAANVDPNNSILFSTLVFADANGQTEIGQPGLDAFGDPSGVVTRNSLLVAPDTCFRVQVRFGKKPEVLTTYPGAATLTATTQCRLGRCGDRGYTAESLDPAVITCVGGSLVSEKAVDLLAVKKLGGVVLSWRMTSELSLQGFNIYSVSNKGVEKKLGSLPCQACNTGESKSYTFNATATQIKGAKTLVLEVLSTLGNTRTQLNF